MKTLLTLTALSIMWLATTVFAQNPLTLVGQYDGEDYENYFGGGMTTGDFNHDGYDEFILGAVGWNNATGKNYIYPGGVSFPLQPEWFIHGQQENEGYDWNDKNVGDVSGDAIDDFAIAAYNPGFSLENSQLNLYFGASPLDMIPDWTYTSPYHFTSNYWNIDSCGDVNGDGGRDFVVILRAYGYPSLLQIFFGGATLDTIPDWTCSAGVAYYVNGLGDVNGDGFSDIMTREYQGSVKIYFGGSPMDTIPDLVFDDGYLFDGFGAGVKDINADGYNDVAFCWVFPNNIMPCDVVHFGGPDMDTHPDAYLMTWSGDTSAAVRGMSCGDFNGDGYGDIISVSTYGFYLNTVQIFLGGTNFNNTPDAFISGDYSCEFGKTVSAGDINGDGNDELLVAAVNYPYSYQGRVYLLQGPAVWTDYSVGVVQPDPAAEIPKTCHLEQNYPNPFNSQTTVSFELAKTSFVNITIYNLLGNVVKTIVNESALRPGRYSCVWAGEDADNRKVPSGIYLLRMEADQFTKTIKMVVME